MELTEGSFWAGNGRRWKLGVEGRSSGKTAMAGDGLSSISAGFGHGRARGWSEWVDGEAAQLGVRRIEAGWRGLAGGITNDGRRDELGFARSAHGARKGNGGTGSFEGARDDKSGARTTRIVGMDDAWSRSPAFSRRYGRGRAQCRAVALFTRLKDFSSSLTS